MGCDELLASPAGEGSAMIFRFAVFLLLVPGFPGQAQTARNSARSITISDDRMRSMVQEIGFEFTEDSAGGVTVFAFPLDGRLVTLSNRVSSIELSACFEGFFDLLKANQWNREHFSSGAYRDEKGCTALRAELYFGGGVTSEMI